MSIEIERILNLCEQLPVHKRLEVADFASFLLSREDDARWERIVASRTARPKLDAFLAESAKEGAEPLDQGRL